MFILVLIIYIFLIPLSTCKYAVEHFSNNVYYNSLPWSSYNRMFKRNIHFINFPKSSLPASERALLDKTQSVRSYPEQASCKPSAYSATESHSIVNENLLTYNLKYICIGFVSASNASSNSIIARCKTREDWVNISYLLLLDSLFVEMKKSNNVNASFPYYITLEPWNGQKGTFTFTNQGNGPYKLIKDNPQIQYEDTKINLNAVVGKRKNLLFPYKKGNEIQKLGIEKDTFINTKAFYLENENVAGKTLQFTKQGNNKYIVFSKDFEKLYNRKNKENEYHFYKLISTIYNNIQSTIPTFTLSFSIKFPSDVPLLSSSVEPTIVLLEMFMNNELGLQRQQCLNKDNLIYPLNFNKNGNILSVALQYPKQNDMLKLKIGASVDGCLFESEHDTLSIDVPSLPPNSSMNITITTDGKRIITLLQWNDTSSNENLNIMEQQWICSKRNVSKNNDFYKLFMGSKSQTGSLSRLENIIINANDMYVDTVKDVVLGYKNFAKMVYDKNQI